MEKQIEPTVDVVFLQVSNPRGVEVRLYHEENRAKAVAFAELNAKRDLLPAFGPDGGWAFSYEELRHVDANGLIRPFEHFLAANNVQAYAGWCHVERDRVRLVVENDEHDQTFVYNEFTDAEMTSAKTGTFGTKLALLGTFRTRPYVIRPHVLTVHT